MFRSAACAPRALLQRDARPAHRLDRHGQGGPRSPAPDPRAPLPTRRGDASGPTPGATRSACPAPAADRHDADYVVFCGVHFMAESADILTGPHQQVILPDLNAGCSMADMADIDSVEEAWESLAAVTDVERVVPVTYMNSSAALKAFVGRHGGAVCTSSNARAVLTWALDPAGHRRGPGGQGPVLPRPAPGPQHRLPARLGRRRHAGVEPPARHGGPRRRRRQGGHPAAVEGPLLGPSAVPARARRRLPGRAPRRHRPRPPRVCPRRGGDGRRGGVHRLHHPGRRRRARRIGHRRGHRDPSRQAARRRAPRQDRGLARPPRVPVLDHVPDRRRPSVLGARAPGRRGSWSTGSPSTTDTAAGARVALERMLAIT